MEKHETFETITDWTQGILTATVCPRCGSRDVVTDATFPEGIKSCECLRCLFEWKMKYDVSTKAGEQEVGDGRT